MKRLSLHLVFALACLLPSRGLAGSFTLTPTRVDLDGRRATALLQIQNQGDGQVVVQLSAKDWTQDDAATDRLEPTGELVVFPKMLTLAAGEQRGVRVGFPGPAPKDRERAFRLYAEELPIPGAAESDLRMALSLSVPVFVHPAKEILATSIDGVSLAEGSLSVTVKNAGNTHVLVP